MTIRPYTGADCAAVAGLMNAIEVAADGEPFFTEAAVRDLIAAEVRDLASDTRVVVAPDGVIVAVGMVATPSPGGTRARLEGGVHPRWRERGIGRALLAWQLERAAELHAAHDPGPAWRARTGASVADQSACRLFQRFGLRPVRYFVEMAAPTAGLAAARVPAGVRVAAYSPDLRGAVYAAYLEATGDHWDFQHTPFEAWAARSVDSELFRGDLSRMALDGGEVVCFVLCYDNPGDRMYIGLVGTRRRWRKQGLASALVTESLTAGAKAGLASAWLTVDSLNPHGALAIYERLGFTAQHEPYAAYQKELGGNGGLPG
jgi:ribosomal protein S18 acetylase RimI-like enzyme